MHIVLFWVDYLHYHIARINAACRLAENEGNKISPIAIRPGSPEFPVFGYQHNSKQPVHVLAENLRAGSMQSRKSARKLINVLNDINPDAIAIAGYDTRVALAALGWCRRHGKGAILMSETQRRDFARRPWKEWPKHVLLRTFDAALVGGKPHADYLTELGMPPECIFTGYDVVDNDFWTGWAADVQRDPKGWRRRLGLPDHFFLTACRLVPKKNVAGLLHSYAQYNHEAEAPWPLVIVGDGPLRNELETLAQSLQIARQVHFMGYRSANELGPIYGLASAFILASAYSEQWGLVVNEAMAAGLPVLVSQVCGCVPDLVLPGITGYAFDAADETALSNLLACCSDGRVDLAQIGQQAQKHIQSFAPEHFAKNLFAAADAALNHAQKRHVNAWPLPLVWP